MDTLVLETPRLRLRAPHPSDTDALIALAGAWEVARRLARMPHPYGPEDARFFFENVVPHERVWAIALRPGERFIGVVGLVPGGEEAELGYWLGRPWWGRGLATEACAALVSHAFGPLALRALVSGCFSDNPASAAVLRKLGFAQTGEGTRFCLAEGRELPFVEMRLERRAAR